MKHKLTLGISIVALALVISVISPVASADRNSETNNQQTHQGNDNQQTHQETDNGNDDDENNDQGNSGTTNSDTTNSGSGNPNSPTAIYAHLEVATCTIDPITSVHYGWCPDKINYEFNIQDSNVTRYSVIAITVVPPVTNPLATVQCFENSINYTVGTNQGFGIGCNSAPLPGSGLNYVIFNPSPSWYVAHNIKP